MSTPSEGPREGSGSRRHNGAAMIPGFVFSVSSAFAFGLLAILVKLSYQTGLEAMELLQYRWFTGAAILFVYLFLKDRSLLRANPKTLLKAFLLGAVGHSIGSTCFFKALMYIPASSCALMLYFYPVVVTLLSILFLQMKANRIVCLSLILISSGCSLVFYDAFLKALDIRGILFSLAAMLICSCSLIGMQIFLRKERFLTLTFYMVLFTALAFLPVHNPLHAFDLNGRQLLLCLSLGLISTAIAYIFLFRAIETVGSAYTSIFATFEPVTTVVMSFLILNENIVFYQILGMALIVAGIILPNLKAPAVGKRGQARAGGEYFLSRAKASSYQSGYCLVNCDDFAKRPTGGRKKIMSNPRLRIDLEKITHNARRALEIGRALGVEVMGVTKGAAGIATVAQAMLAGGIESLADSRLDNIARLRADRIQAPITLLRSPGPSDVARTVELADASLNSDVVIVKALSIEARMQRKIHGVILMVDLQTGREGLPPEKVPAACRKLQALPGILLKGIGAYFHLASDSEFHLPGLQALVRLANQVETELGKPLAVLSGGSSNILRTLAVEGHPNPGINHLRIGTAILLGFSSSLNPITIDGFERDTFILQVEVIEVKQGQTGEVLLALGKLDTDPQFLFPMKPGVNVRDASSDHLMVQMDPCPSVGDWVSFRLGYPALCRLMVSPYIQIEYVKSLATRTTA